MTIESEFKQIGFLNGQHGRSIYSCTKCFALVVKEDRKAHRDKMHSNRTKIIEENTEAYDKAIQEVRHVLVPENEIHAFDPGGRAHWDMPRCAVKWCREMEDHPNHRVLSSLGPVRITEIANRLQPPPIQMSEEDTFARVCIFCGGTEPNDRWWKCCPQHCTFMGDDVVCEPCARERHQDDDNIHRSESSRPGQVDDPPHGS